MLELALSQEKIWFDKYKYDEAEKVYFERLAKLLIRNGVPTPFDPSKDATTPETVTNPKSVNKKSNSAAKPVPPSGIVSTPKIEMVSVPTAEAVSVLIAETVSAPKIETVSGLRAETVSAPQFVSAPTKVNPNPLPTIQPVTIKIADSHTVQAEEKRFKVKDKHSKSKKRVSDKLNKEEKKVSSNTPTIMKNTLADEVAKARQHIKSSLECMDGIAMLASGNASVEINNRINSLENENTSLKQEVKDLALLIKKLEYRIDSLEKVGKLADTSSKSAVTSKPTPAPAPSPVKPKDDDDDDDGVDLFGSDSEEEDEETKRVKEQRLAEYTAKKSKKPQLIAKSNIILDVKPWDDETDMKNLEKAVRAVTTDGLVWGASKLVPLAYGIHKLQISCVVEDEKVSVDWLQETIQEIEDFVQSVDIAAFNKV